MATSMDGWQKPKVSREFLELHGITYDVRVYSTTHAPGNMFGGFQLSLPSDVEEVRQALLKFDNCVPESWRATFQDETTDTANEELSSGYQLAPPDSAYSKEDGSLNFDISDAKAVAEKAKNTNWTAASDSGFIHFLHTNIFDFAPFNQEGKGLG